MPTQSTSKQLWRDVQVFDGLTQLDEAMNVLVEGGRIAGLWPARDFDEAQAEGAVCAGSGGVLTPGLVDCHTHL
ncbi:MAG TPA: imidazolonepropionase, partial [Pseudomonas sp.]|nr:imidazolonepropionase [Pseudomonas sp.]